MKYLSLCAIVKNEAPYIKEWLEFHRLQGVAQFYIYDNQSSDNLREVLSPYILNKVVVYTEWLQHPGQITAYDDCIKRNQDDSCWIGFIDIDEFIFPPSTETLDYYIRRFEYAGGLVINWRVFGSSGHIAKPKGLVLENYLKRAPIQHRVNRLIKLIVNPRYVAKTVIPHMFTFKEGAPVPVNEYGREVRGWESTIDSFETIRIHHYFTKSREEFAAKIERGRATQLPNIKRTWEDFKAHDMNDEIDDRALQYIPLLKENMQR